MNNRSVAISKERFSSLVKGRNQALINFLGNEQNAMKFMSSLMSCVQANPKLLECTEDSLMGACMSAAALKLFPGGPQGDCEVLPYYKKGRMIASFQVGYRGYKTLAYRSGILRCGAELVYSNDTFEIRLGSDQRLLHIPNTKGDRGKLIGTYAWAEVTKGSIIFEYMTEEEVMKIKAKSPGANSDFSPWKGEENDPMKWMWRKTAFKQMAKMMPTSDEVAQAIQIDNEVESGEQFKMFNDPVVSVVKDEPNESSGSSMAYLDFCDAIVGVKTKKDYMELRDKFKDVEWKNGEGEAVKEVMLDTWKNLDEQAVKPEAKPAKKEVVEVQEEKSVEEQLSEAEQILMGEEIPGFQSPELQLPEFPFPADPNEI